MIKQPKPLLIIGLLIAGFHSLYSQSDSLSRSVYEAKVEAVTSRLERELGLTGEQTQQVRTLMKERFSSLSTVAASDANIRQSVDARTREKLSAVLTKEQFAKYLHLRRERQTRKAEFLKQNPDYSFSDQDKELDF